MATEALRVLLWGAGQHGRVAAEYARSIGWTVVGFADRAESRLGSIIDVAGARVLITEDELHAFLRGDYTPPAQFDCVFPTVGDNQLRWEHIRALGSFLAPPLIHRSAVISPTASIGDGTLVCPLALVNTEAEVGSGVIVNSSAVVGHNVVLGDAVHLAGGAVLTGGVRIGARTLVGACATAIPGICVGADVTIGAGAVVLHDVPDGITVVGVPARPVGRHEHENASTYLPVAAASVRA